MFTSDECTMLIEGLFLKKCMAETGTIFYTWNDALKMDSETRKNFEIREPNFDQLSYGNYVEQLIIKLGRLRMNGWQKPEPPVLK